MDGQDDNTDSVQEVIVQTQDSSSIDNSSADIVGAILTIPATMIMLAFFSVIYKIFINRRLRG